MRVFISADIEGVAGVVSPEQLGPGGFEYAQFRELMTEEVLAAVEGARAAGATDFVVADSHGNGLNLLVDRFPDDVELIRSWPRPLHMMQGVESAVDAAFLVGYHTAATNPAGVRAHSFSSAHLAAVELNGEPASEARVNAAIAGHFGVPVVLVTGDDAAVAETQAFLPGVEGVAVKRALGFHSAATRTPAVARRLIRDGARRALERRGEIAPFHVPAPLRLDVTFKNYRPVELLEYLPGVERTAARTIRFEGGDVTEVSRFLQFILKYEPGLTP
jgi:D-amino peptidase